MRFVILLFAVVAVAGLPDSQRRHRGVGREHARKPSVRPTGPLTYDAVYGIATHNSYWVDRSTFAERGASGTQERILDQLLHEHVRALELDVHFNGKRPGVWSVYHTDNLHNTFCATLDDCLKQLQVFHYVVPNHDVVNIVIELKELWGHVFDGAHTIEQFDAVLRRALGDALYTPRDFAARCAAGSSLRACARDIGWPPVEELRGKFIVNVLGNFNYNANDWVEYASGHGGVLERAGFPMRSILDDNGDGCTGVIDEGVHDAFDSRALAAARDASIFWQVEQLDYPGIDQFLDEHGVVRGHSAPTYNEQRDRLTRGFQLIQTDHPWHVIGDEQLLTGTLNRSCRLRDAVSALGGSSSARMLVEPGDRLYVSATDRELFVAAHEVDDGRSEWETLPSMTRPDSTTRWAFDWSRVRFVSEPFASHSRARGVGCLRAATTTATELFTICSQRIEGEHTRVSVTWRHAADGERTNAFVDIGDLLKLRVVTEDARSCAEGFVASHVDLGTPVWRSVGTQCFGSRLVDQGIAATRDVLFVGTRHDHVAIRATDLPLRSPNGVLTDASEPIALATH